MSQKFQPTQGMIDAARKVFMAMAWVDTVKPIVLAYQRQILAEGQWHIPADKHAMLERRSGNSPLDTLVLDPSKAYMLAEDDFKAYYLKCETARVHADLHISTVGGCPLLEAQGTLMLAKRLLVEQMEPISNQTYEKLISTKAEAFGKFVEMTLRHLAPFVATASDPTATPSGG